MPSDQINPSAGRPLSAGAVALMLMLCLSWGFNQIAVKLVLPDVPPMLQALIRSVGALPVLLIIGWWRGVKFFERDGSLVPGLLAGTLFGIEFVLIFTGLVFTSASRSRSACRRPMSMPRCCWATCWWSAAARCGPRPR